MITVNNSLKGISTCLLGTAALIGGATAASAQAALAVVAPFTILGGTNVTCTGGAVIGEIGVAPGATVPYKNTNCAVAGEAPPATNVAAVQGEAVFIAAYDALEVAATSLVCTQLTGSLAGENLAPGDYCIDGSTKTGLLTLDGPPNAVWFFFSTGALTGTNFSVVMAGGGHPCDVYWVPGRAASLTTSSLLGNILAGDAADGSITLTGGSLTGRALATVAVTTTDTNVVGCEADTYSGGELYIPSVQVLGGSIYTNVVITVGSIISAGGGTLSAARDAYNPANNELTIAAIQLNGTVYTNAIITVGKLLSVGGSGGAAATP